MSDETTPANPQHRAPPPNWRPLSGLAITAFVLSLIFILVALLGFWIAQLIPLALGVMTLKTVKADKQRGRVLGTWAIVIALSAGTCSYAVHSSLRDVLSGTGGSILSILSSKDEEAAKTKALRSWAWPQALEKDPELIEKWMTRFDTAVGTYGPWRETFELPSIVKGSVALFFPPDDAVELGTEDERPPGWMQGTVIWLPAVFEKGIVHVAVVLEGGDMEASQAMKKVTPGQASAVVGDLRFYRSKSAKAP